MSNKAAAPLLALIAVLSWGAMFPIAAHAIPTVEPLHLTALRYGLASVVFVALLWRIEGRRSLRPQRTLCGFDRLLLDQFLEKMLCHFEIGELRYNFQFEHMDRL